MSKVFFFIIFKLILTLLSIQNSKCDKISNQIPISMAFNNNYVYPTLVSMTSLLENKKNESIYNFYLLVPDDLTKENKEIIQNLEKKYTNCSILFFTMGQAFKDSYTDKKIPTASYYRLYLPKLIPDINRVIYLDGDTIIYEDLSTMYNLNMEDKYMLGFPDCYIDAKLNFNSFSFNYVCAGVILLDLGSLRQFDYISKFENFLKHYEYNLIQHDQTTLNMVLGEKVGRIPARYGMWNFDTIDLLLEHNNDLHQSFRYDEKELIEGYMSPAIIHYAGVEKPWETRYYGKFKRIWWKYAEKTGYINQIKEKYKINSK